jgi:uncharacterized protein involved in exopolysaccharide biosynthesis
VAQEDAEVACDPSRRVSLQDVAEARLELEEKQARYEALRRARPDDLDEAGLGSEIIAELLLRHESLSARLAELARRFDPESPMMRSLYAEAAEVERQARAELARTLATLQAEIDAAQARLSRLQAMLREQSA